MPSSGQLLVTAVAVLITSCGSDKQSSALIQAAVPLPFRTLFFCRVPRQLFGLQASAAACSTTGRPPAQLLHKLLVGCRLKPADVSLIGKRLAPFPTCQRPPQSKHGRGIQGHPERLRRCAPSVCHHRRITTTAAPILTSPLEQLPTAKASSPHKPLSNVAEIKTQLLPILLSVAD